MHVAYLDLKKVSDSFQPQLNETICRVTESGWYLLGKELEEFERKFASFCGSDHCIGVANGLDALTLILQGYIEKEGWQAGDEIIVPAHTFVATILAISRSGLKPVLCDVSLETALLDVDKIRPLITSRTRAILWVHLYGLLALPDRLQDLLQQYHLKLIEDAAQAHGAEWHGKRAGNWGDASAFSFYPGKNLGALGDGGAVVTSDTVLAHIVRQLRNYGSSEKYIHTRKGVNSRLDDMQAAILSLKLDRLQEDNTIRQTIADRYLRGLSILRLCYLPRYPSVRMSIIFSRFVAVFAMHCNAIWVSTALPRRYTTLSLPTSKKLMKSGAIALTR